MEDSEEQCILIRGTSDIVGEGCVEERVASEGNEDLVRNAVENDPLNVIAVFVFVLVLEILILEVVHELDEVCEELLEALVLRNDGWSVAT